MLEQTVNIRSVDREAKALLRKISVLAASLFAVFLSACIPVGDQQVNADFLKSKDDMQERAAVLHPGMAEKTVFDKLDIPKYKFTHMNPQDVQTSLYGNSQVQG